MINRTTAALLILALVGLNFLNSLPARAQETVTAEQVSNEVWGIRFTAPGYKTWDDHPLRGKPQLLAAGAWNLDGCAVNLSLFAVLVKAGTSPVACRAGFAGNPAKLKENKSVAALVFEDAPLAWTRFEQTREGDILVHQFYGYQVRDESCFELHASAISCQNFKAQALPIFESLTLEPRPDVNLETVGVGNLLKLKPTDGTVHMVIAGEYLHSVKPAVPSRARRYYENALRLSKGDLSFEDEWTILEGIGLTWLHDNDGSSAIPSLEKALDLARSKPSAERQLNETLYNLACAYSLAGNVEKACATAAETLEGLKGKERKAKLKELRQDPQLEALREAGCIKDL